MDWCSMKHELIFWDIIENMLTSNTGSTTVLLEAITGCSLNVKVLKQETLLKNRNLQWSGNRYPTILFILIGMNRIAI